jgi:hypothetical protein
MNGEPGASPTGNRLAETGAVDQNQAINPFRSQEREAERDPAAHRQSDQAYPLEAKRCEEWR